MGSRRRAPGSSTFTLLRRGLPTGSDLIARQEPRADRTPAALSESRPRVVPAAFCFASGVERRQDDDHRAEVGSHGRGRGGRRAAHPRHGLHARTRSAASCATVIGAVGDDRGKERLRALESLECVESVTPILQPFKLASREVRSEPTAGPRRRRRRRRQARSWSWPGRARWSRASRCSRWPRSVKAAGATRAARRRLQAAHVALRVPGARGGGAEAAGRGASARPGCRSSPR